MNRLAITLALAGGFLLPMPVNAVEHGGGITASQVVNAPAKCVYEAVQHIRNAPGHILESYDGKTAVVKENWTGLPLIGEAICVYQETEVSDKQIDYRLVSSDKITKFEGSWTFEPIDGGKKTLVKLSTTTEANIKLPFSQLVTDHNAAKRAACRVREAAKAAEAAHALTNRFCAQR